MIYSTKYIFSLMVKYGLKELFANLPLFYPKLANNYFKYIKAI